MNEKGRKRMQVERRKANQREAGECLVLCDGTDNGCLAVPCDTGGRRVHTEDGDQDLTQSL